MPVYEGNTRKIVRRLEREGWANTTLDAGLRELVDSEVKRRGLTRSAFLASAARDKITGAT